MYQQRISRNTIAETLGISYNSICIWIRAWENGGDDALLQGKRGRRKLKQCLLNPLQEEKLQQVLCNKKKAAEEGAEIWWGDETRIKNTCQARSGSKGKTSVIDVNVKRFSINMISAINSRGSLRFMLYKETMTDRKLIRFFLHPEIRYAA